MSTKLDSVKKIIHIIFVRILIGLKKVKNTMNFNGESKINFEIF